MITDQDPLLVRDGKKEKSPEIYIDPYALLASVNFLYGPIADYDSRSVHEISIFRIITIILLFYGQLF